MTPEPVIYSEDWVCRTDEKASFTCRRRGIWRLTSKNRLWEDEDEDRDFVDYVCSRHLVGLLHVFVSRTPVIIDRERQGNRIQIGSLS